MTTVIPTAQVDRGNRTFWTIVVLVVGYRVCLTALACCAVCVVVTRLMVGGPVGLWAGGWGLPATMFAGLLLATGVTTVFRLVKELRSDRSLRRELGTRAVAVPGTLDELAGRVGLSGRATVLDGDEPFAFTYGLVVPRVAVSRGLVECLDRDALAAVLAHEAAHVRSRDPLKVLVTRVLAAREFYLPALRYLNRRFVAGRELAADRYAMSHCGTHALAAALLRTLGPPTWAATTPAAAMASSATLDARITQLETGSEPVLPSVARRPLMVSAAAATLVLVAATNAAVLVQQVCMRTM